MAMLECPAILDRDHTPGPLDSTASHPLPKGEAPAHEASIAEVVAVATYDARRSFVVPHAARAARASCRQWAGGSSLCFLGSGVDDLAQRHAPKPRDLIANRERQQLVCPDPWNGLSVPVPARRKERLFWGARGDFYGGDKPPCPKIPRLIVPVDIGSPEGV